MEKIFELTNPQKSIWMTEKFFDGTNINNICATLTIKEDVKLENLNKAINLCIKNNKSLRLKFKIEEGNIKQYFDTFKYSNFEQIKLKNDEEVKKFAKELSKEVFDIEKDVLFKFKLYKLENGYGGLIIVIHHIISDAATLSVMAKDIIDNYCKIDKNEEVQDKEYSYEDYIKEEQEYLKSSKFLKDKEYWESIYETIPEVASIPQTIENDEINTSISASREEFQIDKDTLEKISEFCKNNKVSNFNFFMAVYAIYLGRVSNLNDFVIGTPILNRTNFKEKNTTGMFINTAPLRIKIEDDINFINFVKNIAQSSLSMLRYQKYPYQMLLEELRKKDSAMPTLYDVMLSYQVTKANDRTSKVPYEVEWLPTDSISNSIYIHLHDNDDKGTLNVEYDYQVKKYQKEDIVNLHKRILNIIEQVLENHNCLERDIEIVTKEEKNKILNEFNNTYTDYPRNKTIVDLFEEQVQKTPDNTAVVFEEQELTYRELNEKSNSLAHYLIEKGIRKNEIVGLCINRSLEVAIGILGILKSGAAYLPIDPEYPKDRVEYMIADSNCKFIFIQKEIESKFNFDSEKIDINSKEIYDKNKTKVQIKSNSEDLAYVIYTSGSTGTPKGVMLKRKGLRNLIFGINKVVQYDKVKSIAAVGTISFDITVLEVIIPLMFGMKVVIANNEQKMLPNELEKLIDNHKIEMLAIVPSRIEMLLNNNCKNIKNLKKVLLGGEAFSSRLYNKIKELSKAEIYNAYGPTEITVASNVTKVRPEKEVSIIGKPISNVIEFILDKNMQLLPVGVSGELYIGGEGLFKGYINNNKLTEERIIDWNGYKLYKSGDFAFFNKNGEVNYIGRNDNQIKLRGLRIELR